MTDDEKTPIGVTVADLKRLRELMQEEERERLLRRWRLLGWLAVMLGLVVVLVLLMD